jgi:hypothetical protein
MPVEIIEMNIVVEGTARYRGYIHQDNVVAD